MSKKEVLIVGPNFYGYNESVAKAFQVKGFKTNIINFEEVAIRKSLFFRLYVGGTIEYGNVIFI